MLVALAVCSAIAVRSLWETLRIATVPFTLRNLREDLEDVGPRFDGAPDLEFRLATAALGLKQSGLSYQRAGAGG